MVTIHGSFFSLLFTGLRVPGIGNVGQRAYGTNSITVVITRQSQSLPRCSLITAFKCSLFFPEQCFWCQLGGTSRQRLVETLCNVSLSADNNGGAKLSCPTFPFSSFFQFSTSTSKIECIHQWSGEKRHLVVSGVNCLLFSRRCSCRWKIKSSQRWQFICSYRKKRRLCFDQQRSWTLLSTCCTVSVKRASSIDLLGFCIQRQQTCSSRGQQGFAAACVFVALLLPPEDLYNGIKWDSFCSLLITHHKRAAVIK